jgi:hypothetical protein
LIHIYESYIFNFSFLLFLVLLFCIYGNKFHNISLLAATVNICLSICHLLSCINLLQNISLIECKSGRTQKLPFGANTEIELKHVTATSGKTGTLVTWNIPHYVLHYFQIYLFYFWGQSYHQIQMGNFSTVPLLLTVSNIQ